MHDAVDAYIGLGANLGEARATVLDTISRIAALPEVALIAQSSLFGSTPVDAGGPDYVNAVVHVRTPLNAMVLLDQLQSLEQQAGRTRPYTNAPRTLDLDLLLYGGARIASARMTVPHPRMFQRAFVLRPLAQIAPELVTAEQLQSVADQAADPLA
jgi:2-amino-4-hydroxy-6-hydroxymethyldihydropteridine diphosphokinase